MNKNSFELINSTLIKSFVNFNRNTLFLLNELQLFVAAMFDSLVSRLFGNRRCVATTLVVDLRENRVTNTRIMFKKITNDRSEKKEQQKKFKR